MIKDEKNSMQFQPNKAVSRRHAAELCREPPDAPHSLLSRRLVQRRQRQRRVLLGAVTGKRSKDPERAVEILFTNHTNTSLFK